MMLVLVLSLLLTPQPAQADWPPFDFRLIPSYENGKITYSLKLSDKTDWLMTNVIIKIAPPEGTRFLEARSQPITSTSFDGAEVTFLTAALVQPIADAAFVVEVTDPAKTTFTTHAWISWQGEEPGDYLTKEISIDITRQPLNWTDPPSSRLRLRAIALVEDGFISYSIYPANVGRLRMWDVKINVPVPVGATFLSAEAPPPFVSSFDGREVSFFAMELERELEVPPLRFKVAIAQTTPPLLVTHAWASWKNSGRNVGRTLPLEEDTRSGDIIVQPYIGQQVISDKIGDVPFASYDLTSIAMQNEGDTLTISLYTAGELGQIGEPFRFDIYIDKDCQPDTGQQKLQLGADYLIVYRLDQNRANFNIWDAAQKKWVWMQSLKFKRSTPEKKISILAPQKLLENSQQFCWQAEANYATDTFSPAPPNDITAYAHYTVPDITAAPGSPLSVASEHEAKPLSDQVIQLTPVPANLSGKLAVPLDNGYARYDTHIFMLPDGQELAIIPHARQPDFRFDGQYLLINQEGGGEENLYEYNPADGTKRQVSDAPEDSHPSYDPWGNRVVYGNRNLIIGANGTRQPFIFVQCGLKPPHLETEPRCRNIPSLGVLVPAGQMGEIQGTHPIWTGTDMIVFKGCNTWAGSRLCGLFSVPSASTKGLSDGFIPRQLTQDTSDIPTDTKGNLITFMSRRNGDWEAYVMDLDGAGLTNLSNSPASNDGLPALSPDGNWVAFVSDRDGTWAIWATPVTGGDTQKLFDLPNNPWGERDRDWTNERISWGP